MPFTNSSRLTLSNGFVLKIEETRNGLRVFHTDNSRQHLLLEISARGVHLPFAQPVDLQEFLCGLGIRGDLPQVSAVIWSGDGRERGEFDARQWLEYAEDAEILALAECGWGQDFAADAVANSLNGEVPVVTRILRYAEESGAGFEVQLNGEQAMAWLKAAGRPLPCIPESSDGKTSKDSSSVR